MESYEGWAYRNGYMRQLALLERDKFLERTGLGPDRRIYRLTEKGRLQAIGGRDPEQCWARKWDGQWRLVIFDVPLKEGKTRHALRNYLRKRHFGCLQMSVWVTPDPVVEEKKILGGIAPKVRSLAFFESRLCGGETNEQIVRAAWDFEAINEAYADYLAILAKRPEEGVDVSAPIDSSGSWITDERESWIRTVSRDPLLPASLLPSDYLGRKAWLERKKALGARQPGRTLATLFTKSVNQFPSFQRVRARA